MTKKYFTSLSIAIIMASVCTFYVQAANTTSLNSLENPSKALEDSLLYPLEEPIESELPKPTSSANKDQLYYPNLFQNDLFNGLDKNSLTSPTTPLSTQTSSTPPSKETNLAPTSESIPVQQPPTNNQSVQNQTNLQNATNQNIPLQNQSTPPQTPINQSQTPQQATSANNTATNADPSVLNPKSENVEKAALKQTVGPTINFNNVAVTEYIRFISRLTNKNFIFDENDLQFTVTIVSEEPTTVENIMAALLQELRIHDLDLIEQGNTIIIHRNSKVASISKVVTDSTSEEELSKADIVTKVFRLNTLEAERAAVILKPMVSASALVEIIKETNQLIVTDLSSNIREITTLLQALDSPHSGFVIGQYVVRTQQSEVLIAIASRIIAPIAQDQKISFIPHRSANSIFVVANPYLVERTLAILKYLDQTDTASQILNPRDLNFLQGEGTPGQWILDKNGNWQFIPGSAQKGNNPPVGVWKVDDQGNWYFEPGPTNGTSGPDGKWVKDKDGNWIFQLNPGKSIAPQRTQKKERNASELPIGHIERTQFSIYKLQYRKGGQIAHALGRIAESLATAGERTNIDLLQAINSVQWIESSNSLIFTGTPDAVAKVKMLIQDVDVPLRQVLLEMLILETDITDSLNFSTNVAANFGGGNTAGAEGFFSGTSTLPAGMATTGVGLLPNAASTQVNNQLSGFVLGIIGQTITHNGTEYASLGGLIRALTQRSCTRIVMNPKILTEDNSPAEVFVGLNTQFPTQSIANNLGTTITQNFEFRDVGTTIKVTPIINNNDVVTLEIQEEVSSIVSGGVQSGATNTVIGPTTKINRTTTKVHVPNRFFLILSGMLSDQEQRNRTQVPCLGSIPVLGAAFSDKQVQDTRQNVMIFVHPIIIDTEEEIDNITKHNQDIYRVKNRRPKDWVWETDEAMDFFNIIDTDNRDGDQDCY